MANTNNTNSPLLQETTPPNPISVAGVSFDALGIAEDEAANTGVIEDSTVSPMVHYQQRKRRQRIIRYTILALVLLIGTGFVLYSRHSASKHQAALAAHASASQRFGSLTIPLSDNADTANSLSLQGNRSLTINGQLIVNNSVVIAPTNQPTNAVAGQLYYDKTANVLSYYNGQKFLTVLSNADNVGGSVSSIGGATGAIDTGNGLSVAGNTLSNSGVLTLQGESGNVSLVGGSGIAIDGTTLSNSGVLSLGGQNGEILLGNGLSLSGNTLHATSSVNSVSGSGNIIVTDDGSGNLTISTTGQPGMGTVTSPGGTSGKLAVFDGVQDIVDSLVSQSGGVITVTGNLNVTGSLSLGSALSVTNGGTGATSAANARTNLGAAKSGANSDITSLSGLTTALTVLQGGTGIGTLATNGVLVGNGTSPLSSIVAGSTGQCLISTAGAPAFGTCPGSGGVASLNGGTGTLSVGNASLVGSTITINDATTATKGIASFNSGNFTVNSGAVNTIQNIATSSSPTFTGLTLSGALSVNTLTPTAAATFGVTGQNLTLQGATTKVTSTNGANTATLSFVAPTATVTYQLQTATAGTYDICTTAGNCVGSGGGVTTPGGTTNKLAKFSSNQTIADSIISDNGTLVTVNGNLSVTGSLTLGTALSVANGGTGAAAITQNGVVVGNGTSALGSVTAASAGQCLLSTAGAPVFGTCPGSGGVVSVNGLTGIISIANASGSGATITINDATAGAKGIASFNSTNFTVTSGAVNTIQNINTTAAPTFGQLALTSSQASNPMLVVNNTNVAATGNLLDLQINGTSKLSVAPTGNLTTVGTITSGTINGQTISTSANFTGSVAVGTTLTVNTVTPTSALTIGASGQSFTLQGNASSKLTATSGANVTTVGFQTPTASVTYNFAAATTGSYDICTTAGNCVGTGGGVTSSGGTAGKIAKFTGAQGIADSIISDNGTTVSIAGALTVNTLTPSGALTIGASSQNLTLQGATVSLSATSGGITNSLTFATPTSSNKTITVPNASGTVAVSATGPLSLDASGNLTCASCLTSGGGGAGGVSSLNGATGALTLQGASAGSVTLSGSTLTVVDATSSTKGLASFNSTNLTVTSGAVNTIQDIAVTSTPTFAGLNLTTALNVTNGGTGATSASGARTNLGAAASGANGDITSLSGLTTALSVAQGGTGVVTTPTNGQILIGNGSGFSLNTLSQGTGVTITNTAGTITISAPGSGTCASCAATSLNNLAGVAINTSLLPGTAGAANLGSSSLPFGQLSLAGTSSSPAVNNFLFTGVSTGGTRTLTLPDASGTVAVSGSGYIALNATTGNISFTGTLAVADGGTGANNAISARSNLGAAKSGANSDITSLTGLTTPLSVVQGGTGVASLAANGVLLGNGTSAISAVTGSNNQCLVIVSGTPIFTTCPGSGGVASVNGLTGALTINNATGSGANITIDDATTTTKGIASFNSTNFTVTSGAVNTIQNISTTSSPTFASVTLSGALNANTITPTSALTVGAAAQSFTLQGSASSTITATGGGYMTTVGFSGTPTAAVIYNFDRSAVAGTYTICTSIGNCAGSGGGVTTGGGTTGKIAKFTSGGAIGDSLLSESAGTVTIAGNASLTSGSLYEINGTQISSADLSNNANLAKLNGAQTFTGTNNVFKNSSDSTSAFIVQNAAGRNLLNVDTTTGKLTLGTITSTPSQGVAGTIILADGTSDNFGITLNSNTLTANRTISLPDETGTVCLQNSANCGFLTGAAANGNYIQLQASTPGTAQTGHLNITGTASIGTSVITPSIGAATDLSIQANGANTLSLGTTGAGTVNLGNANATTVNIANNAIAHSISIGSGAAAQTVTLGSTNGASATNIQGGTGNINLLTNNASASIIAKSITNSTLAFQVQNASSVSLFTVDTSTSTITLGTAGNSLTLTAGTFEPVLSGTARHAKRVMLPAEYAGAVLDAQSDTGGAVNCSTNSNGTMTSGFDSTSRQNYYNWTATGSAQCYDVVVQIQVPSDFDSWNGGPKLFTYNSVGTDTTSVSVDFIDTTGTNDTAYSSTAYNGVTSGTTGALQTLTSLSGTYNPSGFLTMKIRLTAASAANVRIGNIALNYYSKY